MKTYYPTELEIIQHIKSRFPNNNKVSRVGIGDDCAHLNHGYDLITTDALVESVHFNAEWMSLADVAYRCLTANLSDIFAMGGDPKAFVLTLGIPPKHLKLKDIDGMLQGFKDCLKDHDLDNCELVGGDVVRSPQLLFLSITMLGQSRCAKPLLRSTANPGDKIVILGEMGKSSLGLNLLKNKVQDSQFESLYKAFRRPIAQKTWPEELCQHVTAMMDLSDGLWTDLPKIMEASKTGARIELGSLTFTDTEINAGNLLQMDLLENAVFGGEDFSLLLTVKPESLKQVMGIVDQYNLKMHLLGECTEEPKILYTYNEKPHAFKSRAFSHF